MMNILNYKETSIKIKMSEEVPNVEQLLLSGDLLLPQIPTLLPGGPRFLSSSFRNYRMTSTTVVLFSHYHDFKLEAEANVLVDLLV